MPRSSARGGQAIDSTSQGAYALVQRLLAYGQRGLGSLLAELKPGQEVDWLEYKAVFYPADPASPHLHSGDPRDAFYWHVTRAVVAMANAAGGAVIVGIADDGTVIGLEQSEGFAKCGGDEDRYIRSYVDRVFEPRNGIYDCGRGRRIQLCTPIPNSARRCHVVPFRGQHVAVITVRPVADDQLIYIRDLTNGAELYPFRRLGNQGGVKDLQNHTEIQAAVHDRSSARPDLDILQARISRRLEADPADPMSGHRIRPDAVQATRDALDKQKERDEKAARRTIAEWDDYLRGKKRLPRTLSRAVLTSWLLLDQPAYYRQFHTHFQLLTFEEIDVAHGYPLAAVQNFEKIHMYDGRGPFTLHLTRAGAIPSNLSERQVELATERLRDTLQGKRFTFKTIPATQPVGAIALVHAGLPRKELQPLHGNTGAVRITAGDVVVGRLVLPGRGRRVFVAIDRIDSQHQISEALRQHAQRVANLSPRDIVDVVVATESISIESHHVGGLSGGSQELVSRARDAAQKLLKLIRKEGPRRG